MATTDTSKTPLQYLKEDAEAVFKRLDQLNRDLEAVSYGQLKSEIEKATRDMDSVLGGILDLEEKQITGY